MAEAERPTTAGASTGHAIGPAGPAHLAAEHAGRGADRRHAGGDGAAARIPFPGAGLLAFLVFGAAALTDFIDGQLARARGEVSPLGIFMDLTADKVLVAGVLIAMVEVSLLSTWIAALLLIRELVVQGVRQLAASADVVMPARTWARARPSPRCSGWGC